MDWKRWLVGTWDWKRPFKSLLFIYLSLLLVACSFSNKFIFHPPPPQYSEDSSDLVLLDPGESQVACFFLPPDRGERVLLWSHGNAEDIGALKPLFVELHAHGFGVLAYDYPGFGLSAGSPGERSCFRAMDRAYRFLTERENTDPKRIILVGQSVGSGPACWLAEREEVGGVVLIAPFLSAFRTVTRIPIFPGDKFKNVKRIGKIEEPLLVIHGSDDEAVPFAQGRRLFELHGGPKQFLEIPGAGHNDIWHLGMREMIHAIDEFAQ